MAIVCVNMGVASLSSLAHGPMPSNDVFDDVSIAGFRRRSILDLIAVVSGVWPRPLEIENAV